MIDDTTAKATQLYFLLVEYFGPNNTKKINAWYETPNPMFGNVSPETMVKSGKIDKVIQFAKEAIAST